MVISSMKRRDLLFVMLLICTQILSQAKEDAAYNEIPVGVILNMGSWVAKTVLSCISMAVSDFYTVNSHYKTRIVLHNRDTHGVPLHALSAALDLLEEQKVQAIIGSESTAEAKFLAVLGDEARVPVLSFSPSPSLNKNKHPYFLQFTQDETIELKAISAMTESFGWKNVIIISEDTDNGKDMATFMNNAFQERSIFVTYTSLISISASNKQVQEELFKLSTMQTKIYIMHSSHSIASHLFLNAKYLGMMDAGYKWIITSKTLNFLNNMEGDVLESMQGAVGFKSYIPASRDLHNFISKRRKESHATKPMIDLKWVNSYASWAYDAVTALAMALENSQSGEEHLKLNTKDSEMIGLTPRVSALLDQLLNISFNGLGGDFQFKKGRITAQVLEVINVIGKREHRVGFWTTTAAFTKNIGKLNSFSDDGLKSIVWPGGILTNPTHRMLASSRILRIRVPVRYKTGKLFQVHQDVQTNSTVVSGFCGEVFLAALAGLALHVDLEFIPVNENVDGYNTLIDEIHAGDFDIGMGDITIIANRSLKVDFTSPFTDLGVATLFKNADASMWIFMEPFGSDLWLVSACFFIILGFVIWILEHRINEEFQGSALQQIGTTFWFAFSTLVYAHRQMLNSNLSRFVVTVWLFVVLVLVSSYTATLSSLLTVEQIQLASKTGSIGYQAGSPILAVIVRNINFEDTRLKRYSTAEEIAYALSLGGKKGGVDAIIEEIPYIKEFLTHYPSGYSMVVSEMTTSGFGFAFPRSSPMAPAMSTQIARLREEGTLKTLENKWFNQQDPNSKGPGTPDSRILDFKGFRGLFLISGVSMASALILFVFRFIHEKLQFTHMMLAGGKLSFLLRLLVHNG